MLEHSPEMNENNKIERGIFFKIMKNVSNLKKNSLLRKRFKIS